MNKIILLLLLLPVKLFASDSTYTIGQNWQANIQTGNYTNDTINIELTTNDRLSVTNASNYDIGFSVNGFLSNGIASNEAKLFTFYTDQVGSIKQFSFFDSHNSFVINVKVLDFITDIKNLSLDQNKQVYLLDIMGNLLYKGDYGSMNNQEYKIGVYILIHDNKKLKIIKNE